MRRNYLTTLRAAAVLIAVAAISACKDEPTTPSTTAGAPFAQASVSGSPNDVAAIQQIVNTFDAAWTAGDFATYGGQYANVDDWVGPTGAVRTDPAAITGQYQFLFTGIFAGTTRSSTVRKLTFLTGTVAVLDIDARTTGVPPVPFLGPPWQPGILRALEKNILLKRDGEWRIIKHQATSVAPGVP